VRPDVLVLAGPRNVTPSVRRSLVCGCGGDDRPAGDERPAGGEAGAEWATWERERLWPGWMGGGALRRAMRVGMGASLGREGGRLGGSREGGSEARVTFRGAMPIRRKSDASPVRTPWRVSPYEGDAQIGEPFPAGGEDEGTGGLPWVWAGRCRGTVCPAEWFGEDGGEEKA
jgi:hypothetical protein